MRAAVISFIEVSFFAYFLGFVVWRVLLRKGILDRPNQRSSHSRPTVRGGGIAIIGAIVGSTLLTGPAFECGVLLMIALLIGLVSFIDDLRGVPAVVRFGCHAVGGIGSAWIFRLEEPVSILAILGVLSFLWVAGYTNAFNFMDGINGIATSQAITTGLGTALVTLACGGSVSSPLFQLAIVVAGASLGFLPHNFPSARMFMGDVSSAPLGFLLSSLGLWVLRDHGFVAFGAVVLLHLNFVLDTGITLVRRVVRGERWYDAHREHFYQRLVRSGKSHAFVTGWELGLQCLVLGLALFYLKVGLIGKGMVVVGVVGIWTAFFCFAERTFRMSKQE